MNKIKILVPSLLLLAPVAGKAEQHKKSNQRNILIFIADDLARDELSCYGGVNVKTPNIDRLAGQGVRFTHMYASATMSSPVRASIYTGMYPVHNGLYKNHADSKDGIRSIAQDLGDLGYRVGITGKTDVRPKSVYSFEIIDGFEPNCVAKTADYTLDGISSFMNRSSDQPFCLVVGSTLPHAPWTVGDASHFDPSKLKLPPHFVDNKETREAMTHYLAEVETLDKQLGDVLETLQKTGKADNTIIFFCGEQGPQFPGGKWTSWDYGQKSAFIVKSPEHYMQGKTTNALVQYEDLLPTLIDYAGGQIPAEIDGVSILPLLQGKKDQVREWAYGVHNNYPEGTPYPIRSIRKEKYKLILNLKADVPYYEKHLMNQKNYWGSWVRDANSNQTAAFWVNRFVNRPPVEFYDTEKDPFELHNLAFDPAMKPLIQQMEQQLRSWMKSQGDPGAPLDVEKD